MDSIIPVVGFGRGWLPPSGQRRVAKWHLLCSGPMPGVAYQENGSEQLRRFCVTDDDCLSLPHRVTDFGEQRDPKHGAAAGRP